MFPGRLKFVLPLFVLLFVHSAANAQNYTQNEQNCFNMVQGKVAWDQAGRKQWMDQNIRLLCNGTTDPAATIACFQAEIAKKDSYSDATRACLPGSVKTPTPTPKPPSGLVVISPGQGGSSPPAASTYNPWGYTQTEMDCHKAVQLKVRWMPPINNLPPGSTDSGVVWADESLHALCKGTTNPTATIACFNRVMGSTQDPQQGIKQCATTPPANGRRVDFTYYDTPPEEQELTPDELDPAEVEMVNAPLSTDDTAKVMEWIAKKTASNLSPYCYKGSYSRGAGLIPGRVADCPAGYTNNGATCGRNADTIGKGSVTPSCPAGHTNTGFYCYQGPDTYSAPSRLANCEAGYTNMGLYCQKSPPFGSTSTTMVCPTGYFLGPAKRCFQNCRAGYTNNGETCGRGAVNLGMDSMTCPFGYSLRRASGRCVASCPEGYSNTGETCYRPPSTLGMGSMLCKAGEERTAARCFATTNDGCGPGQEKKGGLCYTACRSGYSGSATECYQSCPATQPIECAAGCAKTSTGCALTTANMIIAPLLMAYSLATLGGGSQVSQLGAAAGQAGVAANAGKIASAASAGRMLRIFNSIKKAASAAKGAASTAVGSVKTFIGPDNLVTLTNGVAKLKTANKVRVNVSGGYRLVNTYAGEYSTRFSELTSPEIAAEIDKRFGPIGARQVKMAWARHNLGLMLQAKGFETAQTVMGMISAFDPTGITGVVSAFLHPVCADDAAFPTITVLYKD